MSRIVELQTKVRTASEAVARAEQTAARFPQYASAFVTIRSAEKLRDKYEDEFKRELLIQRVNACSYRVDYEGSPAAIRGITSAVAAFQDILTNVYHALLNGPKKRAKPSQDSIDATRLDFAFAFDGSVGIMMTIPNNEDLLGDSVLSKAMQTTFQLLSASNAETLDSVTEVTGLPAVKLAHWWASENAKYGFGAGITWRAENPDPISTVIQRDEIIHLAGVLGQYIAKERIAVVAMLQHVNMFEKTFEMSFEDQRIVGSFDRAISSDKPAVLPRLYMAYLTVATRVATADEVGSVTYFLDSLEEYAPISAAISDGGN